MDGGGAEASGFAGTLHWLDIATETEAPTALGSPAAAAAPTSVAIPAAAGTPTTALRNGPAVARGAHRVLAGLLAGLCFLGVPALWAALVLTRTGQLMEQTALSGSLIGARFVSGHARSLLQVITMPGLVALILAVLLLALWRGSRRRALWAAGVVVATNVSTQVIKHWVLWRPEFGLSQRWDGANTLPSGHTAVAASAAVALVLVTSRRWRPLAAWAGALVAAAVGYSTLVCQWHRPADVVVALLLALGWGALAVAGGCWQDEGPANGPGGRGRHWGSAGMTAPTLALLLVGLLAGLASVPLELWTLWGAEEAASVPDELMAYAAGAAATVATACAGMAVLVLLSGPAAASRQRR